MLNSFERASLALALAGAASLAWIAGDYHGRETAPLDSERATAQVLSGDVQARWAGYQCGDDGATLITREMPSLGECKEVRLLSESASFPAPGRAR